MFLPKKKHFLRRAVSGRIAFGALLAAAAAGLAAVFSAFAAADNLDWRGSLGGFKNETALEVSAIHSTPKDRDFYDRAYAELADIFAARAFQDLRGLVLPHHLLAAPLIAGAFDKISGSGFERVVIVAPDHLGRARAGAVVSEAAWRTPYGIVLPDQSSIDDLKKAGAIGDERPFAADESVAALVPFISKSLPQARVAALMVNDRLKASEADALARAIPDDGKTLVVASVDFSHYEPRTVAALHDLTSRAALSAGDAAGADGLDVDSPESLRVFLLAMSERRAAYTLLANASSADFVGGDPAETTSYVLAAFRKDEGVPEEAVTVLAVGDMMLDRGVRLMSAKTGFEYPFEKIRGKEDRFFRGVDVIVGNLEGAISVPRSPVKENDFAFDEKIAGLLAALGFDAVNLANNHSLDQGKAGVVDTKKNLDASGIGYFGDQVSEAGPVWSKTVRGKKITFVGFNLTDNPFDEKTAEALVRRAAGESDYLIVEAHWGDEYKPLPNSRQKDLGRKFIEWGADAVVGHHPHIVEGMEVWQGKPIFWSLGNFIFDQDWSEETRRGLALGLAFTGKGTTVFLLPVAVEKGQPRLVQGEEKTERLKTFIERSALPEALLIQAETGIIQLNKQ